MLDYYDSNHMQRELKRSFYASILRDLLCKILWDASTFPCMASSTTYPLDKVMQVKRWLANLTS